MSDISEPNRDTDLDRMEINYRLGDWTICDSTFADAIKKAREARDERDAAQEALGSVGKSYISTSRERSDLYKSLFVAEKRAAAAEARVAELTAEVERLRSAAETNRGIAGVLGYEAGLRDAEARIDPLEAENAELRDLAESVLDAVNFDWQEYDSLVAAGAKGGRLAQMCLVDEDYGETAKRLALAAVTTARGEEVSE